MPINWPDAARVVMTVTPVANWPSACLKAGALHRAEAFAPSRMNPGLNPSCARPETNDSKVIVKIVDLPQF
jgi:hypothetical protein